MLDEQSNIGGGIGQKNRHQNANCKNGGVHLINLPVGAVASTFYRHLCADECIYILEGNCVARIGPDLFQIEAGDFIGYPAGGEAHDIRNTGSTHMICLVLGQRLEFDIIDYPEQNKRLYRYAGQPPDLVDIATVSHPRLSDHHW